MSKAGPGPITEAIRWMVHRLKNKDYKSNSTAEQFFHVQWCLSNSRRMVNSENNCGENNFDE